jgi:hypothetical protein
VLNDNQKTHLRIANAVAESTGRTADRRSAIVANLIAERRVSEYMHAPHVPLDSARIIPRPPTSIGRGSTPAPRDISQTRNR